MHPVPNHRRAAAFGAALLATSLLASCHDKGGTSTVPKGASGVHLVKVEFGALADVYGLVGSADAPTVALHQRDVFTRTDLQDERGAGSRKLDAEVGYDFISANPDTLQPRLLIPRQIGSAEFDAKVAALDSDVRLVRPARFGDDVVTQPFSVVPRNAALRLTFSGDLGITDEFFVQRDAGGRVIGVKNTEAVQLLKIVGDPRDNQPRGDFEMIPARVIVRGNQLLLDPVLLGSEGLQYQAPNNASGLPEAPDQVGANIRLALAIDGPLRLTSFEPDDVGELIGTDNGNRTSVVRDFRSGNRNDDSADISRGFVRDAIPPRIVGEILMYLERVEPLDETAAVVTIYKNGVIHEIDRGDVLRMFVDNSGVPVVVTEIIIDPRDDNGQPGVQHVRVVVQRRSGLEDIDPSRRADYPDAAGELEPWLVANAPKVVLVAEYTAERREGNQTVRDDPRYFLTFSPSPLPKLVGGVLVPSHPDENVSPFASAIVRFNKPIDMATVKGLDTLFFGTRDLLSASEVDAFRAAFHLSDEAFDADKFATPHLVFARVRDEDGSQTSIRLQPELGFYLDATMRRPGAPAYPYYLHLRGGADGIRDLSGNALDFQSTGIVRQQLVVPFTLDVREGVFPDNLVVTVARRLAGRDEDEQPSYYLSELSAGSGAFSHYRLPDLFGSVIYFEDGSMGGRQTSRLSKFVDDLNQQPAPPQSVGIDQWNPLAFCPLLVDAQRQVVTATAAVRFGAPLQNPLNPHGCRLQASWREIDMSLSRTDADDLDLDIEQMYWAAFTAAGIEFDEFDRESLFLGHAEYRAEPCIDDGMASPSLPNSGLRNVFAGNYVSNPNPSGGIDSQPAAHPAYIDVNHVITPNQVFKEPNDLHRYLPLPGFQKPYFVWRDETVMEQGGASGKGSDVRFNLRSYEPFIISPFLAGRGRFAADDGKGGVSLSPGFWDSRDNYRFAARGQVDAFTGGLLGSIALPLLADFWTYPDHDDLPIDNPFRASGANGWQVALAVQGFPPPSFRVYSAGGRATTGLVTVAPGQPAWDVAAGGINGLDGRPTRPGDNTVFWVMADLLKRQTVATFGFVEITNPHRMPLDAATIPDGYADPRLGPYFGNDLPASHRPVFSYTFEPDPGRLPGGTAVIPEFRAAGVVDTASNGGPWAAAENGFATVPDAINFPLDPLKACDAHIRKFDDRDVGGRRRDHWTYYYNRNVTSYVAEPNLLMDPEFTSRFAGPSETFLPHDVKYFNWRMIMKNNVEANPPVSPVIESFAVTYRFERLR